jgi:hypothetical protein
MKKEKVILKNKVTPDKVWKEANTFSENKQALNHHGYSHKKNQYKHNSTVPCSQFIGHHIHAYDNSNLMERE